MITFCTFYWVDPSRERDYDFQVSEYEIWDRMLARHCTLPHRRVVVTHRPELFDHFIETVPLDDSKHIPNGCTAKLMVWRPDINHILGGRIVSMDVDCVITGNVDSLFDISEPYKFWQNPNYTRGGRRGYVQGSLQYLTAGSLPELYEDFAPLVTPTWLNRRFGGAEQCWISERLNKDYPDAGWNWNVPVWTGEDGVYGAGRLFGNQSDNGLGTELPDNAKIVFFPGNRVPSQQQVQQQHPWVREHYQ